MVVWVCASPGALVSDVDDDESESTPGERLVQLTKARGVGASDPDIRLDERCLVCVCVCVNHDALLLHLIVCCMLCCCLCMLDRSARSRLVGWNFGL